MAQNSSLNVLSLTNSGSQSMLEGLFNRAANFDDVRRSILGHLDNDDFDSLRMSAPALFACLRTRAAIQGPHGSPPILRYQADLIDRCDEFGLAVPPAIAPAGTVSNFLGIPVRTNSVACTTFFSRKL